MVIGSFVTYAAMASCSLTLDETIAPERTASGGSSAVDGANATGAGGMPSNAAGSNGQGATDGGAMGAAGMPAGEGGAMSMAGHAGATMTGGSGGSLTNPVPPAMADPVSGSRLKAN